jgi:hypothetical protein
MRPLEQRHLGDDEEHAHALVDHRLLGLAQRVVGRDRRRLDLGQVGHHLERGRLERHRVGVPGDDAAMAVPVGSRNVVITASGCMQTSAVARQERRESQRTPPAPSFDPIRPHP